jgi:hypothetical protein
LNGSPSVEQTSDGLIDLATDSLESLFSRLDPSPPVRRDLAQDVADYVLQRARESMSTHYRLIIWVPDPFLCGDIRRTTSNAIRYYFARRRDAQAKLLSSTLRTGRRALALGLGFLFACTGLLLVTATAPLRPVDAFLSESLLLIGWVANWRPIEILLYDRWPLRRERDILQALSRLQIDYRNIPAQL